MSQRHASDSAEQRAAESIARTAVNAKRGLALQPDCLEVVVSARIKFDGIDRERRTVCEIYSHIGPLKAAQAHKISSDMLKLVLAERELGGAWDKLIVFVDAAAHRSVTGRSWRTAAAARLGIEFFGPDR